MMGINSMSQTWTKYNLCSIGWRNICKKNQNYINILTYKKKMKLQAAYFGKDNLCIAKKIASNYIPLSVTVLLS